jgi:hypothetical protein
MDALTGRPSPTGGAWKGLAGLAGVIASVTAGAVAAVLAVALTAALAVVAVMGMAFLGLASAALRNRAMGRTSDPNLIEARHLGGHSWVAYGWDQDGGKA